MVFPRYRFLQRYRRDEHCLTIRHCFVLDDVFPESLLVTLRYEIPYFHARFLAVNPKPVLQSGADIARIISVFGNPRHHSARTPDSAVQFPEHPRDGAIVIRIANLAEGRPRLRAPVDEGLPQQEPLEIDEAFRVYFYTIRNETPM